MVARRRRVRGGAQGEFVRAGAVLLGRKSAASTCGDAEPKVATVATGRHVGKTISPSRRARARSRPRPRHGAPMPLRRVLLANVLNSPSRGLAALRARLPPPHGGALLAGCRRRLRSGGEARELRFRRGYEFKVARVCRDAGAFKLGAQRGSRRLVGRRLEGFARAHGPGRSRLCGTAHLYRRARHGRSSGPPTGQGVPKPPQ
mmetsp:Transcript_2868/g.8508  ORF Transcript_2868/g.8508 Transcript_2868/m.8508 type:complete len:203 (+) Transcript_2868:803-1411(+)